jgi:nucleotide-binding universal stress UspA family protein
MFRRALVSMDLSPATEALVASLPGLKDYGVEEIILVHVAKPVSYPVSQSIAQVEGLRQRLGRLKDSLEKVGFAVEVDVPIGAPAVEVAREAEERDADLVVLGSRSHSRAREAFIGSVAWEVVRRSKVPVFLHRIEASRPDPEAALEIRASGLPDRVIHPTDFSPVAERAFTWVEGLARRSVTDFTLLHVHAVGDETARSEARVQLEGMAERLRAAGATDVKLELRGGSPSEEILSLGGRNPDHLVVMGTHGKGFFPGIVLGSESRQVVRRAAAPVLLVPAVEEG